jgi:Spy/CpxP family protein refolding chaperone
MNAIGRHGLVLALLGGAALVIGGAAVRAESEPGTDMSGKWFEELSQELALTETQQTQVKAIGEEYRPRMAQLREQMAQLHTQMMQLHEQKMTLKEEKHAKIKAALTPEQQGKFDAWRQKKSEYMRGYMAGKMGGKQGKHGMCPMCGTGQADGADGADAGTPATP